MRKSLYLTGAFACVSLIVAVGGLAAGSGKPKPIKALVYHETTGFRHASIPYAIEQITSWGRRRRIEVMADQTSSRLTDEGLAPFDTGRTSPAGVASCCGRGWRPATKSTLLEETAGAVGARSKAPGCDRSGGGAGRRGQP